jgi:hypothetical protein
VTDTARAVRSTVTAPATTFLAMRINSVDPGYTTTDINAHRGSTVGTHWEREGPLIVVRKSLKAWLCVRYRRLRRGP